MKIALSPRPLSPIKLFPESTTTKQTKPHSLTEWIDAIRKASSHDAANTLELAGLLSQAKGRLRYGEWSRLWHCGQLPFSKRKGEMLVVIGQTLGNLDAQNSAQLPSAWNTLYYVARLERRLIEQLIQQGRIHSRLTLQDARALLPEHKPGMFQASHRPKVKQRLSRFAAFVRATVAQWSFEERRLAQSELLRLVEEIELGLEALANHHARSRHTAEKLASATALNGRNHSQLKIHSDIFPHRL